jgi:hypothetical protein
MSQHEPLQANRVGYLSQCDRAIFLFLIFDICLDLLKHLRARHIGKPCETQAADSAAHSYPLSGVWHQ